MIIYNNYNTLHITFVLGATVEVMVMVMVMITITTFIIIDTAIAINNDQL